MYSPTSAAHLLLRLLLPAASEYYYKEYYPTKIFETSDKVALQNYGYYGGSPIEPGA